MAEEQNTARKKHKKWPWILLLLLLLAGALLLLLQRTTVRRIKLDNGFQLYVGTDAADCTAAEKPAAPQKPILPPRTTETLTVSAGEPMERKLNLQQIYRTAAPSVVTVMSSRNTVVGSGVIMASDGYVISNFSAVEQLHEIDVALADGTVYPAALVGSDVVTDLAVLKIDAADIPAATFAEDALSVGDGVAVIGSVPNTSLCNLLADGIVAGFQNDYIQTTAALCGKSQGILLNGSGQVVGICSGALYSGHGAVNGISIAVPISVIKPVVDELAEKGYVSGRPNIGITVEPLPLQAQLYYGLPDGALVTSVVEGSDAAEQGLQKGDVITALNGEAVTGVDSLRTLKNRYQAGDTVTLTVYRQGETITVEITLLGQTAEQ